MRFDQPANTNRIAGPLSSLTNQRCNSLLKNSFLSCLVAKNDVKLLPLSVAREQALNSAPLGVKIRHHTIKIYKESVGIARPRGRFWMVLYRKHRLVFKAQAFDGFVIKIDLGHNSTNTL